MEKQDKTHGHSRFLSLILRHQPERIGLSLDQAGWASVEELLNLLSNHQRPLSMAQLEALVANNNKQRFCFNADKTRIRANQGHSLPDIELNLPVLIPPDLLFHGTAEHVVASIFKTGLEKRSRQYVHLSNCVETARAVGARHGLPVILTVLAGQMWRDGFSFYCSENGVWLTHHVPVAYLT